MIKLVNDLHELAQAEARKLPMEIFPTDIEPLVKDVVNIFKPIAEQENVNLSLDISPELPQIAIDSYRIRQILHNLLANSLRYTPEGGSICLTVFTEGNNLVIEIMDTGKGIEREHLSHLFDRFYRVYSSRSKDTGGTGLGLAIVKAIVEAHDGGVRAFSEGRGKGAKFSIYLPIDRSS